MIKGYSYHIYFILFIVFIAQLFAPRIYMFGELMFLDIFLIYLTYLSTQNSRLHLILIGFLFGLIQDIITQHELLGLFAITKTIIGFSLGTLNRYNKIWNRSIKILFLFLVYLSHFVISSYLMFDRSITPIFYILQVSLMQSIWTFLVMYIINRFILIDNKIIK
tara:strand:+ start:829 stop:1320 length:492 start_codon:yes stop_codon:yes gene_type:complete